MQEIDLDQPSQNQSAGADSANGPNTEDGIKTVLDRVLSVVGSIANVQHQQVSKAAIKAAIPSDSKSGHKPAQSAAANYKPWGRYEKKPVSANADADAGSIARGMVSRAMDARSRKITEHEDRHSNVMREAGVVANPILTRQQGPDGRRYAVAGEVNADLTPIRGNAGATEKKAESVYRSAMSDSHRSAEDDEAGRRAMGAAQAARQQKSRTMMNSPDSVDIGGGGGGMAMSSPLNSGKCATKQGQQQHHDEQNPNSVKMRFLPAVGAALAGAGRYVAGAIATGATRVYAAGGVIRRAAGAARNYLNRPMRKRGFSGVNHTTTRANELRKSFDMLSRSVKNVDASFLDISGRLKYFSPDIARQDALNRLQRIGQSYEQAQRLGPALGEFEKQKGAIGFEAREAQGNFAQLLLPIANKVLEAVSSILAIGNGMARALMPIMEQIRDIIITIHEPLLSFLKWVQGWLENMFPRKKPNPNQGLNQFFNMQVPPPKAKPVLNGKMNMALPIFQNNPQPFKQLQPNFN